MAERGPSGAPEDLPTPGKHDRNRVVAPHQNPEALHWTRGIVVGVSMIAGFILLAMGVVLVLTGTDWGRERMRRLAQNSLNSYLHGTTRIGRLSGNLLVGVTVHDFVITDSAGKPFIAIESFRANYSIMGLLRKRVWIDGAVAVRPLVVLDRPEGQPWNWQRIFARITAPKPPTQRPGWGDWIRFTNATVVDGELIVRTPWRPSERLSATARDSVIRDVLGGGSRLLVHRVTGGFEKVVQLDSITGTIPLLRLSQPGLKDRLLEISALTMTAYPFRPPAANVRDMKAVISFNNDSAWWHGAYVALPQSRATGDGSYAFASGDMTLTVHSDPADLGDMRWVYPRLLANGRGKFDLRLEWRGALQDYQFANADITMGPSHVTGTFGIMLGDTITIHDADLRFAGLDTRTLEQLIPHFSSPRRGTFAGHGIVHGGRHALAVNGDVRFDDQRAGPSRVIANGEIGFLDQGGIRARNLRLQLLPVQVDMARTWMPTLPISGVVSGAATINGSTTTQLDVAANVEHLDRGARSALDGTASIRLTGAKYFDVNVVARPVSLVEVGRFVPAVGLQGNAAGPAHISGTLTNLRVVATLALPEGGRFETRGTLDLASRDKSYDLTSRLYTVNLRTIDGKAPVTSLTALTTVRGRGTQLATMRTVIAADLSTSRWDTVAVDTASVRVTLANGLADVQRLSAVGAHTTVSASGSFGLTRERSGQLTYRLRMDSLGAFNRWLPRLTGAPPPVAPRPMVVARALQQARADSIRVARATEMGRLLSGAPGPRLVVHAPQPVPADTLAGSMYASGTLSGNLYDFDLRGRAGGDNVVARGNFIRHFQSEYIWRHARTSASTLAVGLDADSVSAMGFAFDTLNARLTYNSPGGHMELAVTQGGNRQYGANGDYAFYPDYKELRFVDMTFRFDTALWSMPHPGLIRWGGPGIRVTNFELRNRGNGRVYANGLLPTTGVADFVFDVDNLPVANIVDLTQSDVELTGTMTLHGQMSGTLSAPSFSGAFGLAQGTYNKVLVPELHGRFGYADRLLVTHIDALHGSGQPMTTIDGRIPINLAFTGVTGSRLLPNPIAVDLAADSLPLELIPQMTSVVSELHGRAAGKMTMRGTLERPSLVGAFTWAQGSVKITSTGAMIESVGATVRMANDTVYVDSLAGWAKGPVRVRGTLAVGNWREPSFNLFLVSQNAELIDNDSARVRIDAGLALTGPYRSAYLSGAVTITQGVIYAPEPEGRHVIGAGDPALFNVLDTATASDRQLFPPTSPLLANLRVQIALNVNHDTWVRNRETNVEIYTDDPITVYDEQQALSLTGVITTDRGEYDFMSKRFQIKRGSATFIGNPDMNPTLQVTGEYQVQLAAHGAVNIRVVIGGTLRRPKLSLESDAQPPRTQSELLSLLAFGQSSTSLLAFGSTSIAGTAATSDLFGVGAQFAVRRLAGVALGVAVQQVEIQAGRTFGTDVFDITPADVPTTNAIGSFLTQTKFEAGKYINGRTFVSAQEQAGRLGVGIEHRTADGWHIQTSIEPRVVLLEPTLSSQPFRTMTTYGGYVIREWRF